MEFLIIAFFIGAAIGVIICIADLFSGGKLLKTPKQEREEELNKKITELTEEVKKLGGKKNEAN